MDVAASRSLALAGSAAAFGQYDKTVRPKWPKQGLV